MQEFNSDITYTQIITFRAIFEAGNINKAAKKLKISSASVSRTLKSLEQHINEPLFTRTTRAIAPTELGVQLYELTRSAIDDLTNAVEVICDHNKTPSGSLSLNMARDIYDVFLKEKLLNFQRRYPQIQLEITLSDSFDQQVEHHFDIGFRFGETINENMIARPINKGFRQVKLALFASPDYIAQYGEPSSIQELKQHALIQFRAPSSQKFFPVRLHSSDNQDSEIVTLSHMKTAMVVNNTEVMVDSALQGFGIGYLMDATVEKEFLSGRLIPLLQTHWCDSPNIYMYYAPENRHTLRIKCFLDYITELLQQNRHL